MLIDFFFTHIIQLFFEFSSFFVCEQELRGVLTNVLVEQCSLNEEAKVAWHTLLDIIYYNIYGKVDEKTPY